VYGDCAINVDPNAAQLADIAVSSAFTARAFGIEPRVALLSYATGESNSGDLITKVRRRCVHPHFSSLLLGGGGRGGGWYTAKLTAL